MFKKSSVILVVFLLSNSMIAKFNHGGPAEGSHNSERPSMDAEKPGKHENKMHRGPDFGPEKRSDFVKVGADGFLMCNDANCTVITPDGQSCKVKQDSKGRTSCTTDAGLTYNVMCDAFGNCFGPRKPGEQMHHEKESDEKKKPVEQMSQPAETADSQSQSA